MTAVVTGGAGFIGRRLVRRLLADGEHVVVIDDLSTSDRGSVPAGVELIEVDVSEPAAIAAIVDASATVVFHAAAQVSVARSMEDPELDRRVNVVGTANVAAGAAAAGSRIVFLSSGGAIYGDTPAGAEDSLPAPMSYYAVHKYAAERYVELSAASYAVARLANVYGPGQRSDLEGGVVAIFAEALVRGEPITIYGDGRQSRDFVHADDVADALVRMATISEVGTWNVGSGSTTTIIDLLALMERTIGPAVDVRFAGPRAGDVRDSRLIIDKIADQLGWSPTTSLPDGLATLS